MKWYIMVLKKYAVFTGRASQREFWMYTLFSIIFSIVAQILDKILGLGSDSSSVHYGWISGLYGLAVLVPGLAVTVRRFHDIGKSGWMYARFLIAMFLAVIIMVGYVVYFVLRSGGADAFSSGEVDPAIFTGSFLLVSAAMLFFILGLCIWLLVLLCREGQPHPNRWGVSPLADGTESEIFSQ